MRPNCNWKDWLLVVGSSWVPVFFQLQQLDPQRLVSKRSYFIPTLTTVMALGSARLYLQNVWKLHGLPRSALSDRGLQFVAEFMRELYRLLGITILASTTYHPQSDGQTGRINQELEQYICVFVNE
jgi:hypothetical protein